MGLWRELLSISPLLFSLLSHSLPHFPHLQRATHTCLPLPTPLPPPCLPLPHTHLPHVPILSTLLSPDSLLPITTPTAHPTPLPPPLPPFPAYRISSLITRITCGCRAVFVLHACFGRKGGWRDDKMDGDRIACYVSCVCSDTVFEKDRQGIQAKQKQACMRQTEQAGIAVRQGRRQVIMCGRALYLDSSSMLSPKPLLPHCLHSLHSLSSAWAWHLPLRILYEKTGRRKEGLLEGQDKMVVWMGT